MASGSKEGLSVYGLFHHFARTPQGKSLLRRYFLRPSLDIDVINERLGTASVFLRPENNSLMDGIMKSLGQIKNMRTVMVHLRKGVSNALSKTGGIKSGIWSSLRSVRCLDSTQALLMVIVRILHAADQECCHGSHRTGEDRDRG
jgi:DNA mismatch repair protein MSH5